MEELEDTLTTVAADSLVVKDSSGLLQNLLESGQNFIGVFEDKGNTVYRKGKEINHHENIWQFSILLSMILLFAILRASFNNRMNQFMNAIMATRQLRQLMREENFLFHPFSLMLLLNAAIIYGLILFKASDYFGWYSPTGSGLNFYLLVLAGIVSVLILKIMVLRIIEFLTDTDLGQRENRYTWILFHQFAGIVLMPIAAMMLFGKPFWVIPGMILSGFVLFIFLIFRIGKGFLLAQNNKVYFLHIILYLCALEIIPLIVMFKVLVTQINGFNE